LSKDPAIGRPRNELAKDLRSFPVGRYVVFYLPSPHGIEIVRVLHSARDIDMIFDAEE
jgi:toxin ParE1/3/4